MSLASLARRVRALERRLAPELAFVRMRQLADDLCDDWEYALGMDCSLPEPQRFIQRIAHNGLMSDSFGRLKGYLERCQEEKRIPEVYEIVRSTLEWSAHIGLISILREHPDLGKARS